MQEKNAKKYRLSPVLLGMRSLLELHVVSYGALAARLRPRVPCRGRSRRGADQCRAATPDEPSAQRTHHQKQRKAQAIIQSKSGGFPRLLIRKHKKVSKINVFKGREHGTKSKNLILTGRALIFTSAPFPVPHAIGSRPMAFFHIRTYTHPKTVSIRVRKPLFFLSERRLKGGVGVFPWDCLLYTSDAADEL